MSSDRATAVRKQKMLMNLEGRSARHVTFGQIFKQ